MYIVDCLSRQNYTQDKDEEIAVMKLSIIAIDTMTNIPVRMTMQYIWEAVLNDLHLQELKT